MTNFAGVRSMTKTKEFPSPDVSQLVDMLTYRRAEGSVYQKHFCKKYLKPVFGSPDAHGNYIHIIKDPHGSDPRIAFMAHHDTVHVLDGQQTVEVDEYNFAQLPVMSRSNCLGADCTTGVWLILYMIKCGIPGCYVVHAGEEEGCVGSNALVKSKPDWLSNIEIAISFDRKGTESIITHQMCRRTCSDKFAWELNAALGGGFEPDDTGSYTDSEVYASVVSECTNLSVGYYAQHTSKEYQNLDFAETLATKLVNANWGNVGAHRDPLEFDYESFRYGGYYGSGRTSSLRTFSPAPKARLRKNVVPMRGQDLSDLWGDSEIDGVPTSDEIRYNGQIDPTDDIEDIVLHYPSRIADWLRNSGVTKDMLVSDLGLWEEENWG